MAMLTADRDPAALTIGNPGWPAWATI